MGWKKLQSYERIWVISLLIALSCGKHIIVNISEHEHANWKMFGGNPSRNNYTPHALVPPLKLDWNYKASSAVGKTLLAVNNVLFLPTLDGKIYALNIADGNKVGQLNVKDGIESTCAYFNKNLVIARRYGKKSLYRYDLNIGTYVWKKELGSIDSEPLIHDDRIYVATLYRGLYCLDISDGSELWHFKPEGQFHSSPASAGNLVVIGCDDKKIYALDSKTGQICWQYTTNASVLATPTISDSSVYVGSNDYFLYCLNLADGKLNWKYQTQGRILLPGAISGAKVVFGSNDGKVYAVDRESGQLRWSFPAESVISTSPLISGRWVYFGSLDHYLYAVDLSDGQLAWKFKTKGRIRTSPIVWGKRLFVASEDKYLYAFVEEKTTP